MSEETFYDSNTKSESAFKNPNHSTINTPQWLAEEYEAGNDGQFNAAYHALDTIGVWQSSSLGRAVDVGCGSGRLIEALAKKGWKIDASDVSESMVQKAIERCHGLPVSVRVSDARALTLTPQHYSLVTSFWMIHWLEDARPLLQQMTGAVAQGGHLVLQWSCGQPWSQGFALRDSIQEVFDRPRWRERLKDAPLAMYQHPLEEVSKYVADAGFEILSTRENLVVSGGESPQSLKRALRSAAFAAQTVVLGDDVDALIDECLQLLIERNALQVSNTELIARLK